MTKIIKVLAFIMSATFSHTAMSEVSELDMLFQQLKYADNQMAARDFENKIWEAWFRSGDDEIDALMRQAMRERSSYNFEAAIKILSRIIELQPEYPEAWNQRATNYFFQEKYEKSLQDIATALELEPRHFGAMAGRALIRLRQFKPALAQQNIVEALKLHPYLPEKALFPGLQ